MMLRVAEFMKFRRHKAFTLTETLVGLTVMTILAGVMTLSANSIGKQTAKREADRAAAYLQAHLRRADARNDILWIRINKDDNNIEIKTGPVYEDAKPKTPLKASKECSYLNKLRLIYNVPKAQSVKGTLYSLISHDASVIASSNSGGQYSFGVKGADGKTYNVLIGGQP